MFNIVKNNAFKIILGIPIILQIIGSTINSLHLASYSIVDTNPFRTFQIFSGAIFIAINLFYFVVMAINTDIKEPYKNKLFFIGTTLRIIILSNVTFMHLAKYNLVAVKVLQFTISSHMQNVLMLSSSAYVGLKILYDFGKSKKEIPMFEYVLYRVVEVLLMFLSVIGFILLFKNNDDFRSIAFYIMIIGVGFYSSQISRAVVQLKKMQPGYKAFFYFRKDGSYSKVDILLILIVFILSLSGVITQYSNTIYTYLPPNLGGAKKVAMEIETNISTFSGSVIYQNEKYMFIEINDSIHQIVKDKILRFRNID